MQKLRTAASQHQLSSTSPFSRTSQHWISALTKRRLKITWPESVWIILNVHPCHWLHDFSENSVAFSSEWTKVETASLQCLASWKKHSRTENRLGKSPLPLTMLYTLEFLDISCFCHWPYKFRCCKFRLNNSRLWLPRQHAWPTSTYPWRRIPPW